MFLFLQTVMRRYTIWVALIGICVIELSLYLFLHNRADMITPAGRMHTMENVDAFYPDVIRQGKMGSWKYTESRTTLPIPTIYTLLFFIGAGKIAAIFNIDPVSMYEFTRVSGGIALLLSTYLFISIVIPRSYRILAMIFTMVFETGPAWNDMFTLPMWQWNAAAPAQAIFARHFGLPHHVWSEVLGLLVLSIVFRTIRKPSLFSLPIILSLSIAGPLCSPTYFGILVFCVFIPLVLYSLVTYSGKKILLPVFMAIVGIGIAAIFTKMQFAVGEPWSSFVTVEKTWWSTSSILNIFIQSFLLFYPFLLMLIVLTPLSWRRWSSPMLRLGIIMMCWFLLPIGLIYASAFSWFPLVNGRIASDLSSVPVGILSALVFYAVDTTENVWVRSLFRVISVMLFFFLLGVSFLLTGIYIRKTMQVQLQSVDGQNNSFTLYPTKELWEGMMSLQKVPAWSHIMVLPRVGDVLPAYIPVRSYQGDPYTRNDWLIRRGLSHLFYTGEMSTNDVLKLFSENSISYVFLGPEEGHAVQTKTFYPDLLEVFYKNPVVTIYKVRSSIF